MASITNQIVDSATGLFIQATDGSTVSISPAEIDSFFLSHGPDATISWIKQQVLSKLGDSQISLAEMVVKLSAEGYLTSFGTESL